MDGFSLSICVSTVSMSVRLSAATYIVVDFAWHISCWNNCHFDALDFDAVLHKKTQIFSPPYFFCHKLWLFWKTYLIKFSFQIYFNDPAIWIWTSIWLPWSLTYQFIWNPMYKKITGFKQLSYEMILKLNYLVSCQRFNTFEVGKGFVIFKTPSPRT